MKEKIKGFWLLFFGSLICPLPFMGALGGGVNPFSFFTLSGPLLGAIGWFSSIQWLFWVGVALAAVNLLMNLASGAMKFPALPLLFMLVIAVLLNPWFLGLGVGLLVWTAVESAGEIFGKNAAG